MDIFILIFGLLCFAIGALLLVWFGMNFIAATEMGVVKVGVLSFIGAVAAAVMAYSGYLLISGSVLAILS